LRKWGDVLPREVIWFDGVSAVEERLSTKELFEVLSFVFHEVY
jgi:hypothetical protein